MKEKHLFFFLIFYLEEEKKGVIMVPIPNLGHLQWKVVKPKYRSQNGFWPPMESFFLKKT